MSIKVSNEAPRGIKINMKRIYRDVITQDIKNKESI